MGVEIFETATSPKGVPIQPSENFEDQNSDDEVGSLTTKNSGDEVGSLKAKNSDDRVRTLQAQIPEESEFRWFWGLSGGRILTLTVVLDSV